MSINIQTFRKKIKICRFAATVDVCVKVKAIVNYLFSPHQPEA
jgi:hypothetical protein